MSDQLSLDEPRRDAPTQPSRDVPSDGGSAGVAIVCQLPPSPVRGAVAASVVSLLLKVTGLASALAFQLLLMYQLGASAFGQFSFYIAWAATLAAVARFGADTLAMRLVPLFVSEGHHSLLHGFLRFAVRGVAATGFALALLFILGMSLFAPADADFILPRTALVSAALCIPLLSLILVLEAVLRSHGCIVRGSLSTTFSSLVSIGLLALIVQLGYTLDTASALHMFAAGNLVAMMPLAAKMYRIRPLARPQYERPVWFRLALPLLLSGAIGIFQGQCGTICCGLFATSADAGRFALAVRIAGMLLIGQQAINAVLAPRFSTCHARNDHYGLQKLATLSAWGALLFAALGCTGFALFSQYWGQHVPSIDSDTTRLTVVLMLGTLASALAGSVGYILLMTGHQTPVLRALVASLLITIALNLVLTPIYGAMGSAIAQVVSTFCTNLVLFVLTRRLLGVNSIVGRLPVDGHHCGGPRWSGAAEREQPAAA